MTSVDINIGSSKDYWKGTDYIERKLGSVLDRKVAASTKQVLLDRINFKEASKADPFYTDLKNKYIPLNSPCNKQQNGGQKVVIRNGNKGSEASCNKLSKDELPAPKLILFEREKIQLTWGNVRRVGPGLFNLGNTCFLNSVIQVLTYTPPLVNYLATQEHGRICQSVGFCMLCELQRHVLRTFGHTQNEAIKPMAIIQKLKYIAKHLQFGHQEDSHEFLRYVIDGMMKNCLVGVSEKLDSYSKGTTMVHQVFGGYYRSQVTCERCHHTSNTYDPLMEILLDIKHAHTVTKALQRLINVELLNGDNMYLCPRCKRKVPAKKHLTVHRPPNVMTMCLKRFDCHSLFGTKLNKEVLYPEHLNLRPFMSKNQGPEVNYKLYAVLVHSGYSCNSGHYYCFVKASNNSWYQMNDSTVRQVGLQSVLSQQAYLLFYIRDKKNPKEKPYQTQQQQTVRAVSVNGVKPWKVEGFNSKQNTPKIINEPKKVDNFIGQSVARKPEPFVKVNNHSNGNLFKPTATSLPLTREKISFTLNQGTSQKKPANLEDRNEVASDEQKVPVLETPSSFAVASEERVKPECSENGDQVSEMTSFVENKIKKDDESATKKDEATTDEKGDGNEDKKLNQSGEGSETNDVHATTKWKVTTNETPSFFSSSLLPSPGTIRERTPSLSSDVSNACSIASKTGDWAVMDRSSTQDVGPRLPERQHAGWKVLEVEDVEDIGQKKEEDEEVKCQEKFAEELSQKKTKKRKHGSNEDLEKSKMRKIDDKTPLLLEECHEVSEESRERPEESPAVSEESRERPEESRAVSEESRERPEESRAVSEESRERPEESRAVSEESREKLEKSREMSEESREKSEEFREKSEEFREKSEEFREKSEKSREKSEEFREKSEEFREMSEEFREKSEKSRVMSEDEEKSGKGEMRKSPKKAKKEKKEKRDKKRKKRKSLSSSRDSDSNETERRDKEHKKSKKRKKKKRRHSSETNDSKSQDSEHLLSPKDDRKNDPISKKIIEKTQELMSKVSIVIKKDSFAAEIRRPLVQYSEHSSSGEETTGDTRRSKGSSKSEPEDNKDKRKDKTKSSEDTSSARSRDINESKNVVDALLEQSRGTTNYGCDVPRWDGNTDDGFVKRQEGGSRRRDEWDDEYDRGKVKRTKRKEDILSRSYHGENRFQREHDRRRLKNDGWHYTSPSSSRHSRSVDRYTRRDRR